MRKSHRARISVSMPKEIQSPEWFAAIQSGVPVFCYPVQQAVL